MECESVSVSEREREKECDRKPDRLLNRVLERQRDCKKKRDTEQRRRSTKCQATEKEGQETE